MYLNRHVLLAMTKGSFLWVILLTRWVTASPSQIFLVRYRKISKNGGWILSDPRSSLPSCRLLAWSTIISILVFGKDSRSLVSLSFREHYLKSHIFCIGPSEIMKLRRKIDSEIAPMPWLNFIVVDTLTFLIALMPSIAMSILLEPRDISSIVEVLEIFLFCRGIEEVHGKTELVFARARRCTERVTTLSEVPHSLLIFRTSITTDDGEGNTEFGFEIRCHIRECISSDFPELERRSACCIDMRSTDGLEIIWLIFFINKRRISTHESVDTHIREKWKCRIFFMNSG